MRARNVWVPLLVVLVSAASASAQTPVGPVVNLFQKGSVDSDALPDLSIPEAPAFAILGVSPQAVVRPATPRRFGAGLLNGFDDNGNFQSGLALDVSPLRMALGPRLNIRNYRANPWTRFVSRAQLSLATAKGTGSHDDAIRMAAGLLITPFDLGDPRMDRGLDACFDRVVTFAPITTADALGQEQLDARAASFASGLKKCREDRAKARWNRAAWQIGFAPAWIDPKEPGDDGLEYNGFGVWSSISWGFEDLTPLFRGEAVPAPDPTKPEEAVDPDAPPSLLASIRENAQLIVHARYLHEQDQLDGEMGNRFFQANTSFVGGRLRLGTPDLSVSIDGSYNYMDPEGVRKTDDFFRISGKATLKLFENIWVDATLGGTGGRRAEDNTFANVALRFGGTQAGLGELVQVALKQSGLAPAGGP